VEPGVFLSLVLVAGAHSSMLRLEGRRVTSTPGARDGHDADPGRQEAVEPGAFVHDTRTCPLSAVAHVRKIRRILPGSGRPGMPGAGASPP
jgi:hypothetical protein